MSNEDTFCYFLRPVDYFFEKFVFAASENCKYNIIYMSRSSNREKDICQILAIFFKNIVKEFSEVVD